MSWSEHPDAPPRGTELCRLDELPDLEGKELVFGEGAWPLRLFLVRRGERVWGYVNSCPHVGLTLNLFPDRFVTNDRDFIQCANHSAVFRFEDGHCVAGPCAGESLRAVPIETRDGAVVVGTNT